MTWENLSKLCNDEQNMTSYIWKLFSDAAAIVFFFLGLDKAEKSPYSGWKTNIIGQSVSPENEYVFVPWLSILVKIIQ